MASFGPTQHVRAGAGQEDLPDRTPRPRGHVEYGVFSAEEARGPRLRSAEERGGPAVGDERGAAGPRRGGPFVERPVLHRVPQLLTAGAAPGATSDDDARESTW